MHKALSSQAIKGAEPFQEHGNEHLPAEALVRVSGEERRGSGGIEECRVQREVVGVTGGGRAEFKLGEGSFRTQVNPSLDLHEFEMEDPVEAQLLIKAAEVRHPRGGLDMPLNVESRLLPLGHLVKLRQGVGLPCLTGGPGAWSRQAAPRLHLPVPQRARDTDLDLALVALADREGLREDDIPDFHCPVRVTAGARGPLEKVDEGDPRHYPARVNPVVAHDRIVVAHERPEREAVLWSFRRGDGHSWISSSTRNGRESPVPAKSRGGSGSGGPISAAVGTASGQ